MVLVICEQVESGAEEAHLAQGSPVGGLKVRTGHSRRDISVEGPGGGAEKKAADADGAVAHGASHRCVMFAPFIHAIHKQNILYKNRM